MKRPGSHSTGVTVMMFFAEKTNEAFTDFTFFDCGLALTKFTDSCHGFMLRILFL